MSNERKNVSVVTACVTILLPLVICLLAIAYFIPEPKPYGFDHPNRVLLASELLETLEEENHILDRKFRPTFLPEPELEVVKAELRSRYPFQSLRERLQFQTVQPTPVVRKEAFRGTRNYVDGFFSQRACAIGELHSDTVHDFINRAGQGFWRSPPPEPADLRLWDQHIDRLESVVA